MKKVLLLTLIAMLLFGIMACKPKAEEPVEEVPVEEVPAEEAPVEEAPVEGEAAPEAPQAQ
ncbi:MAG: hypothetical protein ACOYIS_02880 [Candidatus Cloacimonadaceae bacterium]|jgi:hypothetical protein